MSARDQAISKSGGAERMPGIATAPGSTFDVAPADTLQLDAAAYPWINERSVDVPVVGVTLPDGTEFRYGSLIGFSNSVRKVADRVPGPDSDSAQSHLFAALPSILRGDRHTGVGKVENSRPNASMLFSASRNVVKAVRLVFAVEQPRDEAGTPVVLRAGISVPRDHNRLMRALNVGMVGVGGHKRVKRA